MARGHAVKHALSATRLLAHAALRRGLRNTAPPSGSVFGQLAAQPGIMSCALCARQTAIRHHGRSIRVDSSCAEPRVVLTVAQDNGRARTKRSDPRLCILRASVSTYGQNGSVRDAVHMPCRRRFSLGCFPVNSRAGRLSLSPSAGLLTNSHRTGWRVSLRRSGPSTY